MRNAPRCLVACLALAVCAAGPAATTLSAVQLFALADARRAEHRPRDAELILDALRRDLDPEVRAEARFREGMMFADAKRYRQAAGLFRQLLDEKPGATRVRLELARVLAAMGDEESARRELRQARAAGLPADVALAVDRFSRALRATQRFGGSFQVALAPDSNVNRATQARTLDTVVAPLTLSRDARARTGLGLDFAGQGYARLPVGDRLWLVPHVATRGDIYRQDRFNDVSASALLGIEWDVGRDRVSPSIGQTWRWYGGPLYARTQTATVDWLHPAGPRAQWDVQLGASRARFDRVPLQNGGLYNLGFSYDRAIGLRSGVTLSADALRQTAADPGYATTSGGGSVLVWRSLGTRTLFLSAGLHRLEGDEALFLFPQRRREWLTQLSGGASFRKLQLWGLAPLVRVGFERNRSTVGIYRYTRLSAQLGLTRAF
jgi:tetratricopeptide (TPR) repeat protein